MSYVNPALTFCLARHGHKALLRELTASISTADQQQPEALTAWRKRLQQLKAQAEDSSLPAYDRRRQAEIIASLEASLKRISSSSSNSNSSTTSAAPSTASKFSFSSRNSRKAAIVPSSSSSSSYTTSTSSRVEPKLGPEDQRAIDSPSRSGGGLPRTLSAGIAGDGAQNVPDGSTSGPKHAAKVHDEYVTLQSLCQGDATSSISLDALERCIVDLRDSRDGSEEEPSTSLLSRAIPALYIKNISHCLVIAPDVKGSVLIHGASNCVLILKCHQFRMHTSCHVKVILDTDSVPIIEKCTNIHFSSVSTDTSLTSKKFEVHDFDVPGAGQARNWMKMPEDEARELEAVVASMPAVSSSHTDVERILKQAGMVS